MVWNILTLFGTSIDKDQMQERNFLISLLQYKFREGYIIRAPR